MSRAIDRFNEDFKRVEDLEKQIGQTISDKQAAISKNELSGKVS